MPNPTPHDIIKSVEKEFYKKFPFGLEVPECAKDESEKLIRHTNSTIRSLIEAMIEREKEKPPEANGHPYLHAAWYGAKQETIDYLTSLLKEIK